MNPAGRRTSTDGDTSHDSPGAPPFRADALRAIAHLGTLANRTVPTATTMYFGNWLEWPDWLRNGTSLSGSGPLPNHVSTADDLVIIANILDHTGETKLLSWILQDIRQPIGPIAALAFTNAPTLNDALRSLVRLMNINGPYLSASLEVQDDQLQFRFKENVPLGRLAHFMGLMAMVLAYRLVATMTYETMDKVHLQSTYAEDSNVQPLLQVLGCRAQVGAPMNVLSIPSGWKLKQNTLADGNLWKLANEQIASRERMRNAPDTLAEIRARVALFLTDQKRAPRLKQMASEMGTSARTITRILAVHETDFHEIVEQERRARASMLINDPSLSLAEIAVALGFTDMSSFGRSFRHWFGVPPGRFRQQREVQFSVR